MRTPSKALILALAFAATPSLALAQRRALEEARFIDGTIGAVAGALIGGPFGMIAGAAIGYSIGPEIAGPNPRILTQGVRRSRRVTRRRIRTAPSPAQYQQAQPYPMQQYMAYPQQGYPQQPVYMAAPQQVYPGAPGQQVMPVQQIAPGQPMAPTYNPQRQMFNPRQNPLVPPPMAMGGGQMYSAVQSGPNAAGQQGASGAYGGSAPPPAPYGRVMGAPVPVPR